MKNKRYEEEIYRYNIYMNNIEGKEKLILIHNERKKQFLHVLYNIAKSKKTKIISH